MLSVDPKNRKQEEFAPTLAMPELITELRLNTGDSSCIKDKESEIPTSCPMQLDLLPLTPLADDAKAAAAAVDPPLGSQTDLRYLWPHTASTVECFEPDDQKVSSAHSHLRPAIIGIDVNQIPADSTESEDPNTSSPASSTRSPFELMNGIQIAESNCTKREREVQKKTQELDDRTNEINSKGASDEEEGSYPRKKLRLSKEQAALLEESFREHSTLNPKQKQALAKQLCLRPRQVEVWFQNRRARTKLKQTEVDCELLKRCCENLAEENRRLQKELQELRAMKPAIFEVDSYMPLQHGAAATTYTFSMCPSCERLPTVANTSYRFSNSGISTCTQSSAACS